MKLSPLKKIPVLLLFMISCSQHDIHLIPGETDFQILLQEAGTYNLVRGNDLLDISEQPVEVSIPLILKNVDAGKVRITATIEDLWGNPSHNNSNPMEFEILADTTEHIVDIKLNLPNGFHRIRLTADNNRKNFDIGFTEIAVVPPQVKGLRPNSFFASNTSEIKLGNDLELLQMLGIKVQRTHFYPEVINLPAIPSAKALEFDYTKLDHDFKATIDKGVWVLPIAGYAFKDTRSEMAIKMNNHGPPRHFGEFVLSWKEIVKRYPEIRVWELWNEPWIFEWTWAATAADYREMHELWCREILDADPDLRIVAGNSCMFVEDNIEPFPEIWKGLIHGISHHPYANAEARSLRHNTQIRSIDYGYLVNKRMNLPWYYITEGGSLYSTPSHIAKANQELQDLYRALIRQKNGQKLIKLFDEFRHLHIQQKYGIDGKVHQNEMIARSEAISKEIIDLAQKNRTTQNIAERFFAAHTISQEDEIGMQNNSNVNASKVVQYTVIGALHGAYQNNIQWNLGYGPRWTRSNATMAVCNYFLEDRPIVADIWPATSLVYGAVFANPAHITQQVRTLPRAKDIHARWNEPVPADASHTDLKVAVVFALTGDHADDLDTHGQLVLENIGDIRAFDCTGREILPVNNLLTVPLNEYAVYLTSSQLSVTELQSVISAANKENLTSLNLYAGSLIQAETGQQSLTVRIDNHINKTIQGKISIHMNQEVIGMADFSAATGLSEVDVILENLNNNEDNIYPIEIKVVSDAGEYIRNQVIQRALFNFDSKVIDGKLNDWLQSTPVLIDSDMMKKGVELTQYLFNPHLPKPEENKGNARVAAKVHTAFDDQYIYIAAEVLEDTLSNAAGNPALVNGVETGFVRGMPGGLNHPRYTGDMLMFGFGFRDRVPGFGRQMSDPLAWKGQFYDTDYLYLAYTSNEGSQLIRQWGADTPRQNGFQTDPVAWIDGIEGAQIVIERNVSNRTTVYEIAIPRTELALFNEQEKSLRFGFVLINNEGAGKSGKLEWAEAAGVFDYWLNSGSFAPTWDQLLPLQTRFGITQRE